MPTGTDVITPGPKDVLVDSVRLDADETVTFVYTAAMVQGAKGDGKFVVVIDGGVGPGTDAKAVEPRLKAVHSQSLSERQHAGSGDRRRRPDGNGCCLLVLIENELTFTYTAVGTIGYAREFRVRIPAGWSEPNSDGLITTRALTPLNSQIKTVEPVLNVVETLDPSR